MITLITDFGTADPYVAMMKGVILSRLPEASIIDVTHEIPPGRVLGAAFALERAFRYFPQGTVHVVVVDPGVGTARARLAVAAGGRYFVGPDNGCLSSALSGKARGQRPPRGAYEAGLVAVSREVDCVAIEAPAAAAASATFEGRDVFAPAAAVIASGAALSAIGPPVHELLAFAEFRAPRVGGRIRGEVLQVDRFGNLITDVRASDLPLSPVFEFGPHRIEGLSRTYAAARGIAAIIGSSGFVEIAKPGGSAAGDLGLGAGDRVTVTASRRR